MSESLESMIEKFCAITATDEDTAQRFLEMTDGNVMSAIDLFLESSDSPEVQPSPATRAGPTEPIDMVGTEDAASNSYPPTTIVNNTSTEESVRGFVTATQDFVTAARESFLIDARREFGGQVDSTAGALSALYRPPDEITHKRGWQSARDEARKQNRWLLVNVQDYSEFACHQLNRDVWNIPAVRELVTNNFILVQVMRENDDGERLSTYYNIQSYPYIAIIDPRTGQMMCRVECKDAVVFCDRVATFLESNQTPNGAETGSFDPEVVYVGSTTEDAQANGTETSSTDLVRKRPSGDSAVNVKSVKHLKKNGDLSEVDLHRLVDSEYKKYLNCNDRPSSSLDTPVTLVLRFSDGKKNVCRISSSARVKDVYNYLADVLDTRVWDYNLALSYPRRVVSLHEHAMMHLGELQLHSQEVIDLEKRR